MNDPWTFRRARRWFDWFRSAEVGLDLSGLRIYTEAGTDHYRVTAALALAAGADAVHATARMTRFGPAAKALEQTCEFVECLGLDAGRLTFSDGHDAAALARSDLVTNMGMLRPLNAAVFQHCRPGTVVSLMYEPWEFRGEDVDLPAAEAGGLWVVGVNEHNDVIQCFGSAAVLSALGLLQAGLGVFNSYILVIAANHFVKHILKGLAPLVRQVDVLDRGAAGAQLPANARRLEAEQANASRYDALILFDLPQPGQWNVANDPEALWPPASVGRFDACVQALGDIRREDFPGVRFVPTETPPRGYMGFNPSSLGPDLVLNVVAAGLLAGAEAVRFLRASGGRRPSPQEQTQMRWALPMSFTREGNA
jgi:hypothetical protein